MTRNKPSSAKRVLCTLILSALSAQLSAQTTLEDGSTVVYEADYFTEYRPVNAQDMLRRIPGVSIPNGGGGNASRGGRGLGGGGGDQVLINGKRTAGKNNDVGGVLDRITADQVRHIELIRGTSGELDVRGSSQVVNVVLFEELDSNSISYEVNADRYYDGTVQPGGSLALSGKQDKLNYSFGIVAEPRYDHNVRKENSILGDFSPNDTIREDRVREQTSYELTSNITYEINPQSSFRLNALYGQNDNPTEVDRITTDLTGNTPTLLTEYEDIPGERDNWELGGDYEYRRENGDRFKVLFISNEDNELSTRERYVLDNGGAEKTLYLSSDKTTRERIVRGSYTMGLYEGQALEMGIERAQTIQDSSLKYGIPGDEADRSDSYGGLVPTGTLGATETVEEIRYEPFLVHNWKISPKLSLESSLVWETSELTQTGLTYNQRDFQFLKPKLDIRYDVTSRFQLRTVLARDVRQLSFSDFVASTDNDDNDSDTQVGNANLAPETTFTADLNAEYRLPNDTGVLSAKIFYMEHYDKIERIDVSTSPTDLRSTNGNIGDGDMWIGRLDADVRLGMLGLPNVLVNSRFELRDSEIEDPFLGIDRRFTNYDRGRFQLGFRHDVPRFNLNYGMEMNTRFDGNTKRYDIKDLEISSSDVFVSAFAEVVAFGGLTFRFDVRNVTNNEFCRERRRFDGHIRDNVLKEIEYQCSGSGRVMSLKINGTF
ncbi:MAG: TonB-dependent receptor [Pseudohongiellaceae bacterium]|nr:TonB-dependent receptor [Pseudohongiellaceae bacterium]